MYKDRDPVPSTGVVGGRRVPSGRGIRSGKVDEGGTPFMDWK